MVLEVPRDKAVLRADEMQDFDHGFVGRHRTPGREGDRQHGGDEHQDENSNARTNGGPSHRAHAVHPAPMIVENGTRSLLAQDTF